MDSLPANTYWEDSSLHTNLKYERCGSISGPSPRSCKEEQNPYRYCESTGNLNFTTAVNSEDDEYNYHKKKISRDPMSHRIIEKRRRDRMNNCLADLSRLIPADYLKKGRGRIEKTEIIEMAIKHMKYLQAHTCSHIDGYSVENGGRSMAAGTPHGHNGTGGGESDDTLSPPDSLSKPEHIPSSIITEHYRHGYHECLSETMHFLIEVEGFYAHDSLCVSLVNHLRKHCDKQSDRLSANGDARPSINLNCSESTNGTSSPGSTVGGGSSSGSASNCKVSNGDAGSSSSSENGNSSLNGRGTEVDLFEGHHHPSQLRDILTCPSLTTHSVARMQLAIESPSPSTTAINGSVSSGESNHSLSGASYKFKNNIKQRFTAEHPERSVINSNGRSSSVTPDLNVRPNKRRHSIDFQQPGSEAGTPPPQPTSNVPIKYNSLPNVPIFVLHSKGSYYVPLTVNRDILTPYLNDISLDSHPANISSVVLHPVTISVNFHHHHHHHHPHHQKPVCSPVVPMISTNGWSNSNGIATNGFMPLPKWASCTPERS